MKNENEWALAEDHIVLSDEGDVEVSNKEGIEPLDAGNTEFSDNENIELLDDEELELLEVSPYPFVSPPSDNITAKLEEERGRILTEKQELEKERKQIAVEKQKLVEYRNQLLAEKKKQEEKERKRKLTEEQERKWKVEEEQKREPVEERERILFQKASSLFREKRFDDAMEKCNAILETIPHANAFLLRAMIWEKDARYGEMIKDCTSAIRFDQTLHRAYFVRGTAFKRLVENSLWFKRYKWRENAIADLSKIVPNDQNYAQAQSMIREMESSEFINTMTRHNTVRGVLYLFGGYVIALLLSVIGCELFRMWPTG